MAADTREASPAPTRTWLADAFPSPMRVGATVRYEIARAGRVQIEAFDLAGRLIARLIDADREPGRYEMGWEGRDATGRKVAPGLYVLRMTAAGAIDAARVMKIR